MVIKTHTGHGMNISKFITAIDENNAHIKICTNIYEVAAIQAACYPLIDSFHILIVPENDDTTVSVVFERKNSEYKSDISTDIKEFMNSVIDHQLRQTLERSTGKIRDLIVAHAFSPLDIQKEVKSL